ncbi:MAG TPA: outer membrane beta-barrel domain-containing protein [Kofleriaceae bacterium]|jgi:outer membrane beta-barrel protein|nr:outer membrane beta-barrel domain-containing protein [Kofleriaceae bacterium]
MRRTTWKLALIGLLGVALGAGTAMAQKGKGKGKGSGSAAGSAAGSGSGSAEGEIEMGGDEGSGSGSASGSGSSSEGEIEMGGDEGSSKEGDLNADLNASGGDENAAAVNANAATPALQDYRVSWRDIVTVIRKPFLKLHRTELRPIFGTTMNDNIVRHVSAGGELAYYLTDVLAMGVEGQYYIHQFEEPFDLVARQARRLPTVNEYKWSAALDFHYVPVYGKFAVVDKHIVTWEVAFTAGIGAIQTEVVPRDKRFEAFSNIDISPNVGADMRFFLAKWITVNAGMRDYIFIDKFEPVGRSDTMYTSADDAAAHADSSLINNVMFQLSVSFWLPTGFEYHTFR